MSEGTVPSRRPTRDEHARQISKVRRARARLMTLASLDGRTTTAKRVAGLIERFKSDLGGDENLTEGQRQLIQRAA